MFCVWAGIWANIYNSGEEHQRTVVAPQASQDEAKVQELHQQGFFGGSWEEDSEKTEEVYLDTIRASFISVATDSSSNSTKCRDDLVLSDMQTEQWRASRVLPHMPGSLVSGMDTTKETFQKQECESSLLVQSYTRAKATEGRDRLGRFSSQSSMDPNYSLKSCDEEGGDHRWSWMQCSNSTVGGAASQCRGYRTHIDGGRGEIAGTPQSITECQSRFGREHAAEVGSPLGQAAEWQHDQASQPWASESSSQSQDAGEQCRKENCGVRPGMVQLCRQDHVESERTCEHVPIMSGGHARNLQQEASRVGISQRRAQHSLDADVGDRSTGASSSDSSRCGHADAGNAGGGRLGKCCRSGGSNRRHGGGRRAIGDWARTEFQELAEGAQRLQGCHLSDKGGQPTFEDQVPRQQGEQGQRLGGECGKNFETAHAASVSGQEVGRRWLDSMQELWNGSYSWLDWVHHVDDCHSGSHEGKSHMDRDDAMKHVGNGAFMTPVTASCACLQQRASESHKEFEPRLFAGGASLKVKDNHGKKNHSNRGLLRDCKEGHMDLLGSQAISQKNQQRRQDSVDDDCYTWCRAAAQSLVGKTL